MSRPRWHERRNVLAAGYVLLWIGTGIAILLGLHGLL